MEDTAEEEDERNKIDTDLKGLKIAVEKSDVRTTWAKSKMR